MLFLHRLAKAVRVPRRRATLRCPAPTENIRSLGVGIAEYQAQRQCRTLFQGQCRRARSHGKLVFHQRLPAVVDNEIMMRRIARTSPKPRTAELPGFPPGDAAKPGSATSLLPRNDTALVHAARKVS
jgi:hypothetical protein